MKKLNAYAYDTDKSANDHYLTNYEEYFSHLSDKPIKLLELGVYKGGSLFMWRDYFEKGHIIGLDFYPTKISDASGRIKTYQGRQEDRNLLDRIALENAPEGFDIIIDDCSHIASLSRISFWHLFENHLKPGGIYVIEDWGTGYWDEWIDGIEYHERSRFDESPRHSLADKINNRFFKFPCIDRFTPLKKIIRYMQRHFFKRRYLSHDAGMVGFVKELVDELGAEDITHAPFANLPHRASKFSRIYFSRSHCFVFKSI